ncbi:HK97 gp10 family phage protein [Sporosarcina sp. FSL K6-1522]|uniref:HK97 gp10 family phage protein n=1 Tax=Sporosarcina sp. FSL K6-1522 TaxID=2921554 RepID=UPI003159D4E1
MAKDMFSLVWSGLSEFEDDLKGMEKELFKNIEKAMSDYSMLIEEGTRALVHRDHGDLEASINFGRPKREGDSFVIEGGSNLKYALRRHEEPYRPGTHDKYDAGVKFVKYYLNGRGRRTFGKPSWRGEKPGRKFLERAIVATEKDFDAVMVEALEKTLEGK